MQDANSERKMQTQQIFKLDLEWGFFLSRPGMGYPPSGPGMGHCPTSVDRLKICFYYHPRMQIGNNSSHSVCMCVCVCLCICLCVCLSVQTITFEMLKLGTSFLVYKYILTISRPSLSMTVIGSRSRSNKIIDIFYLLVTSVCLYAI